MTLVLPAPTAWARSVLPLLMMRQTASCLVRVEGDVRAHAWKGQVRAVEATQAEVVVGVIVEAYEALGAVRIGEDPGAKALLDALSACRGRPGSPPG